MSELRERLEREVLPLVSRPSRYIGGERNLPAKSLGDAELTFLLAFPDVYEIGMSHLGIRVLYDILNRRPEVAAERAFTPWVDMERLMREGGIPLFSLESHAPVADFDVVGFTLQYELHYSNVLAMLDLAGIPLRAADRAEGRPDAAGAGSSASAGGAGGAGSPGSAAGAGSPVDAAGPRGRGRDWPLIVGGGPCAFNPEPVADFFDILVIGDGESAVLDLADLVLDARREGLPREELLVRAAGVPGFYVPTFYRPAPAAGRLIAVEPTREDVPSRIARRVEPVLDAGSHPACPIVPITETTHDRLAIEIMRGCTRGCRFCHAGMVTRPVRTRGVEDVVGLVDRGVACSGYDEVSLVSLSASDYPDLSSLVSTLNDRLFSRKVSVSLPSLRADRFSLDLADGIGRVRRAGLTFAPEAGTQRLRDVINKNEVEELILETVDVAFASGWSRIKLYFMIGLPTETDDDVEGIADLVSKIRQVARTRKGGARVNVSVSPFVPKAHTPFQWERQDSVKDTARKEAFLRGRLRMKGVKLSTRDPEVSFLEGTMARGDRALAPVIEAAWRAGARFDSWTETFDFGIWRRAFDEAGIEPERYLEAIDEDARLPWDHIEGGASKTFLRAERAKALAGETTPDCREVGCFECGACGGESASRPMPDPVVAGVAEDARPETFGRRERKIRHGTNNGSVRWRVRYRKGDAVRFISHLDVLRIIVRALTMSGLPIAYTRGFNPHPRLSLGPPLPVGATGDAEFLDIELTRPMAQAEIVQRLSERMPAGIEIASVVPLESRTSVSAQAAAAEYTIGDVPGFADLAAAEIEERIAAVRGLAEASVLRGDREKVIRPSERILELEMAGERPPVLRAVLALGEEGALRPVDLVRLLAETGDVPAGGPELARVHRTALLRRCAVGRPGLEPIP